MTIGIDPGIHGGVAVYNEDGYRSEEMPFMATGAKGRNCINPVGLKAILQLMGKQTVYLERVHSMPRDGVTRAFSLGDSFGCIRGVIMTLGYPLILVTPQIWKKHFKLTSDKELCRAKAIQLFPDEDLNRKKDVDRAEALLIAYYGAQQ